MYSIGNGVFRKAMAGILVFSLFLASIAWPDRAASVDASETEGDVIFNYPFNPAPPAMNVADVDWDEVDHVGYDSEWASVYTPETSTEFNGVATPEHVVFTDSKNGFQKSDSGDSISFYGYGNNADENLDYVFTEEYTSYGNAFTLRPMWMNDHPFYDANSYLDFLESGYLFNGKMENLGANIVVYRGYAIVPQYGHVSDIQEHLKCIPYIAGFELYYIDGEEWNTSNFSPDRTGTKRRLISTIKTNKANADRAPCHVNVEIDPDTRAFKVYIDGSLRATVPAGEVEGGATGFGFYTGYDRQYDNVLPRIRYEEISVNVTGLPEIPTTAEVRFEELDTGVELRVPETENGLFGQRYKISRPRKLEHDGVTYYLVKNDLGSSIFSDIQTRYAVDPNDNVTTLYYFANTPAPEKNARVNEEQWNNGTADAPVPVTAGSEIEYNITVYSPPRGRAVMTHGNSQGSSDTSWLNQSNDETNIDTHIKKKEVRSVKFLSLDEMFTDPQDLMDKYSRT